MRRFVKLSVAILLGCLCLGNVAAKKKSGKKTDDPSLPPPPKFDPQIPIGHDAQVVRLPHYVNGKLEMVFSIGLAKRADIYHLNMSNVSIETFDESGATEMTIKLSTSVLDLNTQMLTSDEPVTIKRDDFELTGERMRFNTATRQAKMLGHVRMLVFDRSAMAAEKTAP